MGKRTIAWPLQWEQTNDALRCIDLSTVVDTYVRLWETTYLDKPTLYEVYEYDRTPTSSYAPRITLSTNDLLEVKCYLIAKGYLHG